MKASVILLGFVGICGNLSSESLTLNAYYPLLRAYHSSITTGNLMACLDPSSQCRFGGPPAALGAKFKIVGGGSGDSSASLAINDVEPNQPSTSNQSSSLVFCEGQTCSNVIARIRACGSTSTTCSPSGALRFISGAPIIFSFTNTVCLNSNLGAGVKSSFYTKLNFCYKVFMSRPLRIEYPGAWYHVMNRGTNKQNIFLDNFDYKNFLSLLSDCRQLWNLEIHAYALMPNHYHLLLKTPQGDLSRPMRHLNGVYTQRFNRRHKRDGPLMRGRYKSILVDAEDYLLQVSRYIHLNPVKARIAQKPEDFPWSSYRYYLNEEGRPSALVRRELLETLGSNENMAIQELEVFTRAGIDKEISKFYRHDRLPPVLGKSRFIEWIKRQDYIENKTKNYSEIPQQKELLSSPTISQIISLVSQVYEIPRETLLRRGSKKYAQPRSVAMYLCRNLGGQTLNDIAATFGNCGYAAISNAVSKIKNKLLVDNKLRKRVVDIENLLGLDKESPSTV